MPLPYVSDFIKRVRAHLKLSVPATGPRFFTSMIEEGTLFFDQQEFAAYTEIVDRLVKDFAKAEDLSRRSVESYLQQALFASLDLKNRRGGNFEGRLRQSISELQNQLSVPPTSYRCFVPVQGLDAKDLPVSFGGVRFVIFGRAHQHQLLERLSASERRGAPTQLVQGLRADTIWGSSCAVVNVRARDFDSAEVQARFATRSVMECINFFGDLVPDNYRRPLHFPEEAHTAFVTIPIVSTDGHLASHESVVGPVAPFALEKVRKSGSILRLWNTASVLARNSKSETGGDVILTSIKWAGRASVEPRREQSFLLFAIALEAAMLPEYGQELTYRLSLRVSKLLSRDRKQQSELRQLVAHLYNVRSRVVHSGSYQVTDEDLGRLRWLTKVALLNLLRRRRFWPRPRKDLGAWLERVAAG